ncbi:MAG: hypothetical protein JKY17_06560 [Magnetovibrio sp.]|nr:hypothetical protein [Magnetovibrio sp.]
MTVSILAILAFVTIAISAASLLRGIRRRRMAQRVAMKCLGLSTDEASRFTN